MTTTRPSLVMMALGDYRFGIDTAAYQSLTRTDEWRWPVAERLTREPASQYVGPGLTIVELSGVILPHFRGGLGQLPAMRAEAGKGKPLLLVDGRGEVWGEYCITRLQEVQGNHMSMGVPRRIEFTLSLQAYGEDR